jgi:hypothetical protein
MNHLDDPNWLAQLSPTAILAVIVLALWKREEKRDTERLELGKKRDQRITALETKQDEHAAQYRELAERVADVVGQTKQVMEKVLEKLQ